MTVSRQYLARKLYEASGLPLNESAKLVDLFFSEIAESLARNEEVKIAKFGTFRILEKSARMGRNPRTGESAVISARRTASFKPSPEFRKKL